ncbi:MAG TPA: heme-binding protein [Methylibium sp.]|nr:heme-binding protein [Methylibium sp.]
MPVPTLRRLAALALLASAGAAPALERVPALDLDTARRMAGACEALAQQKGWRMNIAVVDAGAHLLVFSRMDRAYLGSGEIAIRKAAFSARFPFTTRFAEELAYGKPGQPPAVPGLAQTPGVVAFAGGLPVVAGGVQVGGIGVSGGSPDEDEQCAAAGLAAVQPALK